MRRRTTATLAAGLLGSLLLVMTASPAQAGPDAPAKPAGSSALTVARAEPAGVLRAVAPEEPDLQPSGNPDKKGKSGKKVKPYTPNEFDRQALPPPVERKPELPATTRLDKPPAGFPRPWPPTSGPEGEEIPGTGDSARSSAVPETSIVGYFDGITFEPGQIRLRGWALDELAPTKAIQVVARKNSAESYWGWANTYRPDVGNGDYHGFDFTIPLPAARGEHTVCVQAYASYTYANLGCLRYDTRPFGHVEQYLHTVATPNGTFSVFRGWLIDPYTADPARLDVTVDGLPRVTMAASAPHPGVAQSFPAFGSGHGFEAWIQHISGDGNHTVCVYGSSADVSQLIDCKDHDESHTPHGYLDEVSWQGENVLVRGWAIDWDTTNAVSVSIRAGGKPVKTVLANVDRPDIGARYPQYGPRHGFETTIPAVPDGQEVTVTVKNVSTGVDATWTGRYDGSAGPCRCVKESFEEGSFDNSVYSPANGRITSDPVQRVAGNHSVYGESPQTQEWSELLRSDPAKLKLAPRTTYTVTFRYRLLQVHEQTSPYFRARSTAGGSSQDVGVTFWPEPADGDVRSKSVTFTTNDFGDYYMIWGLKFGGAMVVDDIVLSGPVQRS
ncbi:hypothetical protein GCM10010517_30230 [Streptosporangium fragile]|uniref:Uncharacterized protein n=1 Tax=Streptosporangium fragile TaxID=46186 RepID=A0ABN3VXT7_9ACTN